MLTDKENLRAEAIKLAAEILRTHPLQVVSVRKTMRAGLAEAVKAQTDHEGAEQYRLQQTHDHKEGVKEVAERRPVTFRVARLSRRGDLTRRESLHRLLH